jgi:hypothetical protein
MSLPGTLLDGLGEVWPFDEGSGDTAHGMLGALDLTLECVRAGGLAEEGGWLTAGHTPGYAGHGYGTLPAGDWALPTVGDAVTIAIELWWDGNQFTAGTPYTTNGFSIGAELYTVGSAQLSVNWLPANPPPADPASDTNIYYGAGVGAGNGVDTFTHAPPFGDGDPYVLIMECVRTSGTTVRVRLYEDGAQVGDDGTDSWALPLDTLHLGTASMRHAMRRAAVWLRALTGDERDAIFDDGGTSPRGTLAGLVDLVDGGDPGDMVDADGVPVLVPDFVVGREYTGMRLLATDGVSHRHTRAGTPRRRRRYEMPFTHLSGEQLERLRTVVQTARGQGGMVRWRHPIDDAAGSAETAPRWRIVGPVEISRAAGGQRADVRIVLEEV